MGTEHQTTPAKTFEVDLPGGNGKLHLQTAEEADLWDRTMARYINDYGLAQHNDLLQLGAILSQQLQLYRAQQIASGMIPEFDAQKLPTGRYVKAELKATEIAAAHQMMTKATEQIQKLEKALGVDKSSRESGGNQTVGNYVASLKEAARKYGLHISKRTKEYEGVMMEARWKLRILENGDAEDKAYHGISPNSICDWLRSELARLEEIDKQYAKDVGALYLGRVR